MRHTPFDPAVDPFMSPTDCAQEIGRTERFIRGEIGAGRLKAIRVSHKCWRTRRSWWEAYITKRQEAGETEAKAAADCQAREVAA